VALTSSFRLVVALTSSFVFTLQGLVQAARFQWGRFV
jgi:hypothetical protein